MVLNEDVAVYFYSNLILLFNLQVHETFKQIAKSRIMLTSILFLGEKLE